MYIQLFLKQTLFYSKIAPKNQVWVEKWVPVEFAVKSVSFIVVLFQGAMYGVHIWFV